MSGPAVNPERGFRGLDHTADRAIEAWGPDLPGLFRAAAEGMFAQSEDLSAITEEREWQLDVEADSLDDLLRAWLSELLWVFERDGAVPCRFEVQVTAEAPWRVRGRAWGGRPPAEVAHTGAPVKAVTYHDLHIWREGQAWHARVVFDV